MASTVRMPVALLTDRSLTPSAKVVWALVQPEVRDVAKYVSHRGLARQSGLAPNTVHASLRRLEAAGWVSGGERGPNRTRSWEPNTVNGPAVDVPIDLFHDSRLASQAKLVYAHLIRKQQGSSTRPCRFRYKSLARLAGVSANTVRKAISTSCGRREGLPPILVGSRRCHRCLKQSGRGYGLPWALKAGQTGPHCGVLSVLAHLPRLQVCNS